MAQAHPFLYASPRHDYRRLPNPAAPRDPEANFQLRIALHEMGYDFGESILNFPPQEACFDLLPEHLLTQVELPFVRHGDVFVGTTRPPLSDGRQDAKKKVQPSNTNLERAMFEHYFRYFRLCSRVYVELTEQAAGFLPVGKKNRAGMTFYQDGCRYMHLQSLHGKRSPKSPLGSRTAAFLLRVDEVWPGGPGLVAAWGLNALSTLAWCSMLRSRCSWMLENRGLTMVELYPTDPPQRPHSHEWTNSWQMTPVFETGVELPPVPKKTLEPVAF